MKIDKHQGHPFVDRLFDGIEDSIQVRIYDFVISIFFFRIEWLNILL
jgi:hypothetical protein